VSIVIITDGAENSSTEYRLDDVKKIIQEKDTKEDWMISYLGANQDGWKSGMNLGVSSGYSATFNTTNIGASMQAMVDNTTIYNSSVGVRGTEAMKLQKTAASFTDDTRKKLVSQ
jgi:hypothetical protein